MTVTWDDIAWADIDCPDCEAPAGRPCYPHCARYEEDPGEVPDGDA